MTPHRAIIIAGGLGTRLRSTVPSLPKPMAPVGGRPFLEHLLGFWERSGVRRFILAVGYRWECIESHFGSRFRSSEIRYSIESEPLGTGGALAKACRGVTGESPVLVLNGDTYFEVDAGQLVEFHGLRKADFTMAVADLPAAGRYGVPRVDPDGRILSLEAGGDGVCASGINGGVYLVDPGWLRGQPESFQSLEAALLPSLIREGMRAFAFRSGRRFIDIGTAGDYFAAPSILPNPERGVRREVRK